MGINWDLMVMWCDDQPVDLMIGWPSASGPGPDGTVPLMERRIRAMMAMVSAGWHPRKVQGGHGGRGLGKSGGESRASQVSASMGIEAKFVMGIVCQEFWYWYVWNMNEYDMFTYHLINIPHPLIYQTIKSWISWATWYKMSDRHSKARI